MPEIPEYVFEITPCFVQGCQIALWGRTDFMHQFDVHIMERSQRFELSRVQQGKTSTTPGDPAS